MTEIKDAAIRSLWRDQAEPSRRMPVSPAPRTFRIVFAATCLMAAFAIAAGLLTWLMGQPDVYLISCWVTRFGDPGITPNPAADRDRTAIAGGRYFSDTNVGSIPIHSRFLMRQQLDAVADASSSESVVLYISTYAGVDGQGRVVLLSSDFESGRFDSGLPLAMVLSALAKSPARHKLLVLDIFAPCTQPGLDAAGAFLPSALSRELKATPDADRLVLCSCSPGQTALRSETLRRTVFGYYFEQALLGAADGYNPRGMRDGRVTVHEAAEMLRARVDRWARHTRSRRQIPFLSGSGEDFELVACGKKPVAPPAADRKAAVPEYPRWLLAGWKLRERWDSEGVGRLAPRIVQSLEASLLRIEHKWRYGAPEGNLKRECEDRIKDLQGRVDLTALRLAGPDPASLAAVLATGHPVDGQAVDAVNGMLKSMTSDASERPADWQAAFRKQLAAFDKQTEKVDDADIALAILEAASSETPLTKDALQTLALLLRHRNLGDRWVETRTISRLATDASDVSEQPWSTSRARQLLRIVRRREELLCQADVLSSMGQFMDAAAQACHDAEVYYWFRRYVPAIVVDEAFEKAW